MGKSGYKARPHTKAIEKFKEQMKKYTNRSWGVSNAYKVEKLNHEKLVRETGQPHSLPFTHVHMEALEDSEKQSEKPDEAGCTTLGSV